MSTSDVSFKVLSLLSRERGVYGLRNGDHERYRRHCTNKVHRLRQVSEMTCGKGKVFKQPPAITKDNVKDSKQLQLLLFSAERALAHSHGLKTLTTKPNTPPNTRRDQISWLRKAAKYAENLYGISHSLASAGRLSQRALAEITIYYLSIRAELSFEKSNWAESLSDLASRRKLLSTISDGAKDSYDQALANEFIDTYDPLIRFSAYKMGKQESHDIEGVVKDVDDEMMEEALPGLAKIISGLRDESGVEQVEKGRRELKDVQFAGEKVELRSAEIVAVMLKVQDALKKIIPDAAAASKGRGMRGWDKVLSVLGEAEAVAKRLLDDHEASGSSTSLTSTRTSQSLSLAHQYIVYLLLSNRIKRDLLLVETLYSSSTALPSDPTNFKVPGGKVKVEESVKILAAVIKLYDTVLQSMNQLRSLAIVEEKDEVRAGAEGVEAYFHASRCYHLARLHCIHPSPSYASSVKLLTRSSQSIQQAKSSLFDLGIPLCEEVVKLTPEDVKSLGDKVQALDLAAKRALFAERVPKPVFFDTAFNYIDLPMDDLLVKAGRQEAKPVQATSVGEVAAATAGKLKEFAEKVAPAVVERSSAKTRTREATPAVEETEEEKPKGWLGGWFGRK